MYLILAKFRYDWVKIVDFLIKGHFWSSSHWAAQVCTCQRRGVKNPQNLVNVVYECPQVNLVGRSGHSDPEIG